MKNRTIGAAVAVAFVLGMWVESYRADRYVFVDGARLDRRTGEVATGFGIVVQAGPVKP